MYNKYFVECLWIAEISSYQLSITISKYNIRAVIIVICQISLIFLWAYNKIALPGLLVGEWSYVQVVVKTSHFQATVFKCHCKLLFSDKTDNIQDGTFFISPCFTGTAMEKKLL